MLICSQSDTAHGGYINGRRAERFHDTANVVATIAIQRQLQIINNRTARQPAIGLERFGHAIWLRSDCAGCEAKGKRFPGVIFKGPEDGEIPGV